MKTTLLLLLCLLSVARISAQDLSMTDRLAQLGGTPCPDSEFTCVMLSVPRDHSEPEGARIGVTFAVVPAAGESRGLFVYVVGGPGVSGIAVADLYAAYFDPRLFEDFDIVFFDQRGIGASGGLDCPNANAIYALDSSRATTPEGETALVEAARTFAESCAAEMGSADLLPFLGTQQAIHDLEFFRQTVGAPEVWLYGESYGTQYAQEYAAAYPEAVQGLILDGVVDLTLTGEAYYQVQTRAFANALDATLQACSEDPRCASDVGGDAAALYDELAAELLTTPITVEFPLPSGERVPRQYTLAMLEASASGAVYGRSGRALFLRSLAAAARGDLLPLLRLGYQELSISPLTLDPVPDPTFSNGMYYGVECNDYRFGTGTPEENAAAFIEAGNQVEAEVARLSIIYYTDLPCIFWPVLGRAERPAPYTGEGHTTFILNSDLDPATPISNAYSVFDQLADAYMITDQSGPHVIFGRGLSCPDTAVNAWLVEGETPEAREYVCPGDIIEAYVPLAPRSATEHTDALSFMRAVDAEINALPEYQFWDVVTPTEIGCPYSGKLRFEATFDGEAFTFEECALFAGAVLNGSGTLVYEDSLTLELMIQGEITGQLLYIRDDVLGAYHVSGTWNGTPATMRPS